MESTAPQSQADPYGISTRIARSTGTLTVAASVDEVVHAVEEFSPTIEQPRLLSLSAAGAEFKRSRNLRTWGLRITLKFRPLGSDQTLITAKTSPRLPTTLTDGGQGEVDLRFLFDLIAVEFSSGETEQHDQ
jgi:hypothetical protein